MNHESIANCTCSADPAPHYHMKVYAPSPADLAEAFDLQMHAGEVTFLMHCGLSARQACEMVAAGHLLMPLLGLLQKAVAEETCARD
jgi:hypothetical protein